jgi:hypothetical protein
MITRREALLGTLLAPLVKPLAGMLPNTPTKRFAKLTGCKIISTPRYNYTNLYKIIDQLSTGETRVSYKWIEEDYF